VATENSYLRGGPADEPGVKTAEVSSASDAVGVTIRSLIELLALSLSSHLGGPHWEVDREREGLLVKRGRRVRRVEGIWYWIGEQTSPVYDIATVCRAGIRR
jgi:hypothetical protein